MMRTRLKVDIVARARARARVKARVRGGAWALGLGLGVLVGCTVGPNFEKPKPPEVVAWHDSSLQSTYVSAQTDPDPQWWTVLNDPVLTDLVRQAIAGNLDLRQAVLRVVEARQNIVSARAQGLPSLNATGSFERELLGTKGILESEGIYKDLNNLANSLAPYNATYPGLSTRAATTGSSLLDQINAPLSLSQYGLDASWELDLFGAVRRSVEQARASAEEQVEAAHDALIMVESEVVQAYVQLRAGQAEKAAQDENVRAATQSLDLTDRRQRSGLTTELDVDQARTQLNDATRQLPNYDKQIQQSLDALNVLTGQVPGTLDAQLLKDSALPVIPALIGVGVPSDLARRRPDVRQAEQALHAATAQIGVATAAFYPQISITGTLGLRAIDAAYLTNWASHFYTIGPSISVPIFSGGRLAANLRLARASNEEAALRYRSVVLNALREVEDGLVAYRTDRLAQKRIDDTVVAAQRSFDLATNQYENGLATFITALDAQRTLMQERQLQVQGQSQIMADIVTLYRALGGGWENHPEGEVPEVPLRPPPLPGALDGVAAGSGTP